ncbi:uncharacterized protein LOC141717961 [Apium graveolens]|uniref:uncharacterized protein LOC141717961 n=1 Tax=Apium graveolens TaxID=4045 RepID=UPI003D7A82F5
MIPMYKFQFVDLEDLDQYVKETSKNEKEELPEFAIVIIGAVEEMEPVKKTSTKIGLRDVFRFKVTDGRISHRVTVWGDDAIDLCKKLEKEEAKTTVIILTNTKLFKSNANIYISVLPPPRFTST